MIEYAAAFTYEEPDEAEEDGSEGTTDISGTEDSSAEEAITVDDGTTDSGIVITPVTDDASTGNGTTEDGASDTGSGSGTTDEGQGAAGSGRTERSDNSAEGGNAASGSGASNTGEGNPDASGTGAAGEGSGASPDGTPATTDAAAPATQEEEPAADASGEISEVLGAFVQDITLQGEVTFEGDAAAESAEQSAEDDAEQDAEEEVLLRVRGAADGEDVYDEVFTVTSSVTERDGFTIPVEETEEEDTWSFTIEGLHVLDENDRRISYSVQQILPEETTLRKTAEQLTVEPVDEEHHQVLRYRSSNLRALGAPAAMSAGDRGYTDKTGNVALTIERVWPEDVTTTDPLRPVRDSITLNLLEYEGTSTRGSIVASYRISPKGEIQTITGGTVGTLSVTKEVRDAQGNVLAWIFDIKGLPATGNSGAALRYELQETGTAPGEIVSGSQKNEVSGTNAYSYAVTDLVTRQEPPADKVRLDVTKIWQDKDGVATSPNSPSAGNVQQVVIHLTRDGGRTGDTLTLSAANGWSGSFTDLVKGYTDNNGTFHEYAYGVAEDRLPGYETPGIDVSAPDANGNRTATVTNKERSEKREIRVQKKFSGGTEAELAKAKATEIVFTLYIGNEPVMNGQTPLRVVRPANAPDDWEGKFTGLPVYVSGTDTQIDYRVVETTVVEGYTSSHELSGTNADRLFTFTNTRSQTSDTVDVAVRKAFSDANGKTVSVPEDVNSVTVYLTENGTRSSKSLQMNAGNNFSVRFENLPKKDAQGKDITYGVQEGWVLDKNGKNLNERYTPTVTAVTGSAKTTNATLEFLITNTEKPPEEERLIKTVNGEREYKLRESDEEIVYEITGIVPEHAVRMEIRDQMPDVLVTRIVKVYIDGKEMTQGVQTTINNNLVTVYFDHAQDLVGKEMRVRIEAHFTEGADVSGYANYYVDNTAEWYINGEVYGTSRAASIDSEILVIRHNASGQLNARRSKTGDAEDMMVYQLRLMMALMAVLFLATLNPRKKKAGD